MLMNSNETAPLFDWIVRAIEMGVFQLEIEYKDAKSQGQIFIGDSGDLVGSDLENRM